MNGVKEFLGWCSVIKLGKLEVEKFKLLQFTIGVLLLNLIIIYVLLLLFFMLLDLLCLLFFSISRIIS